MQIIVVDEIDRMLKEGHFKELKFIIKHIHRFIYFLKDSSFYSSKRNEHFKTIGEKGPPLQTFVFSATLTFTYNVGLQSDGRNEIKDTQKIDSKQKVETF